MDDGHTGTDTDREHFQEMLSDIMSGKINCVVVKDLSRLARNYSDAGSLIDNLFVQMGVRFISLAENVDSYLDPDSVSDIKVPIDVYKRQYVRRGDALASFVFPCLWRQAATQYSIFKEEKDMKKRLLSLLMAMCLMATMVPAAFRCV